MEDLLKNFLVAGLVHGILYLLGGRVFNKTHPTQFQVL